MKKQNIFRTWGMPYGNGPAVVCEISASSKKEAIQKLEANGVVIEDKRHFWRAL